MEIPQNALNNKPTVFSTTVEENHKESVNFLEISNKWQGNPMLISSNGVIKSLLQVQGYLTLIWYPPKGHQQSKELLEGSQEAEHQPGEHGKEHSHGGNWLGTWMSSSDHSQPSRSLCYHSSSRSTIIICPALPHLIQNLRKLWEYRSWQAKTGKATNEVNYGVPLSFWNKEFLQRYKCPPNITWSGLKNHLWHWVVTSLTSLLSKSHPYKEDCRNLLVGTGLRSPI